MKRVYAWMAGAAGGVAAYRAYRRRPRTTDSAPAGGPDPRAEQLRAKLSATQDEPAPTPEPPADADARRRAVHEQARAAIDEMRTDE